ncbi:MAG: hypothetical protein B7Z37_15295 [Verrucomicrobia bacterium 12-59-8]|nr:MAG: hypothetical protein B7Z37_15295 [Verrucomicrobia bacterium 12-59-8]
MNTPPNKTPRPPLSQFVLTSEQLANLVISKPGPRRPVWRHTYDPYAGAPVAQTVEEALARAAKAPPGTLPEVEMLTAEEVDQRMEEIRNRPPPAPRSRTQARRKR